MHAQFTSRGCTQITKKNTHPNNKNTVCANNFGTVCTTVAPFPFKVSRKHTERVVQTVCANGFCLGGWFWGGLPSSEQRGSYSGKRRVSAFYAPSACSSMTPPLLRTLQKNTSCREPSKNQRVACCCVTPLVCTQLLHQTSKEHPFFGTSLLPFVPHPSRGNSMDVLPLKSEGMSGMSRLFPETFNEYFSPCILKKLVGDFKKIEGKFGWNYAGCFRTHKIKAQTFGGKLRSIFRKTFCNSTKRFRPKFVLQTCRLT